VDRDGVIHPAPRLDVRALYHRKESRGDEGQELEEEHGEEATPDEPEGEASGEEGEKIDAAEILSEGAQRGSLSHSERELVRRAKNLLAGEIALSRREDASTASAWIDEQLARD
jgi:RNA polymerase-interacting CarD/CdnL/TRCF family regulator